MPDFPFNLQSGDFKTFVKKLNIILDELFNERIGGLGEGDVFTINSADNCLELNLSTDGGLEKSSSKLQIKIVATGGLQTSTAGLAAKLKAAYGIDVDADGLKLKKQTHSEFCETVHAITDPADTPASADALRDDLVANTIPSIEAALNDIGTHVNAIIAKLQTAEILLSSSSSSSSSNSSSSSSSESSSSSSESSSSSSSSSSSYSSSSSSSSSSSESTSSSSSSESSSSSSSSSESSSSSSSSSSSQSSSSSSLSSSSSSSSSLSSSSSSSSSSSLSSSSSSSSSDSATGSTWNPSDKHASVTLSGGDLTATCSDANYKSVRGTQARASGKYYFEVLVGGGNHMSIGVATSSADLAYLIGFDDYGYGYLGPNGEIWKNSVAVGLGNPYTASAVIGVAVNWDDSEINFYANDVLQDTVSFTLGTVYPAVGVGSDDTATLRTTVAEFSYSLPSGYLAWN